MLRQMKVHSLQGCAQLPGANCSRRCRVTVGIPPSASSASSASVTVFQHAFDTGPHSRDVGALSTAPIHTRGCEQAPTRASSSPVACSSGRSPPTAHTAPPTGLNPHTGFGTLEVWD